VNTGSAGAQAAGEWVRYCRERDLGVRWWGIGNETYGSWEIGNVPALEYAELFLRFAEAMRAEDPEIELIAVGADPVDYPDWNRTVLDVAGGQIDHLSVHRYVPHTRDDQARERQYRAIVAAPVDIERRLGMVADTIEAVCGPDSGTGVAFDEWNVWLDATAEEGIEERYELRDALFAAGVFHAMHRLGDSLSMANLAQLVNVLPAITTGRTDAWGTAIYRAFELYRDCHGSAIECDCRCPTYDAEAFGNIPQLDNVPWLDATAMCPEGDGRVLLCVVNRHPSEAIDARLEFAGADGWALADARMLTAGSEQAVTSAALPEAVSVTDVGVEPARASLNHRFPPHSATVLTFESCG
jgi:alpha-N-arabinofuranosidase